VWVVSLPDIKKYLLALIVMIDDLLRLPPHNVSFYVKMTLYHFLSLAQDCQTHAAIDLTTFSVLSAHSLMP